MASLQERNGSYRFIFRYHGKQHFVTIGKVNREEADAKAAQVEYRLLRLKQRLIDMPPGIGIVEFLQSDGKPPAAMATATPDAKGFTIADFQARYLTTHRDSLEERTIEGIGPGRHQEWNGPAAIGEVNCGCARSPPRGAGPADAPRE